MRVYLDTNILAFLVGQDKGESISRDVMELLQGRAIVQCGVLSRVGSFGSNRKVTPS